MNEADAGAPRIMRERDDIIIHLDHAYDHVMRALQAYWQDDYPMVIRHAKEARVDLRWVVHYAEEEDRKR